MYVWVKRRGEVNSKMLILNIMFIVFYFLSVFDIWVFCIYLEVKFMYVWCGRVDYVVIFLGINLM